MKKDLLSVIACVLCMLADGVLLGQVVLDPAPAWAASGWVPLFDPPGVQYAAELDLVDPFFITATRKIGNDGNYYRDWQFAFRSADGVIGVWEWVRGSYQRSLIGGIDTGLDRLVYVGFSDPGNFFPGFGQVLMWSGFDAQNQQVIGALPISASLPISTVHKISVPISSPTGGVWVCASIILNGIAVLDGVHSTICWVENGVSLHPGIAVDIPRNLRRRIERIGFNRRGELQLDDGFKLRKNPDRLIVDPATNSVVSRSDAPVSSLQLPAICHAVAGLLSNEVLTGSQHSGQSVVIEAAPAATGPWSPISAAVQVPAGEYLVRPSLTRALTQGEWIRARDLLSGASGDARQVGIATVVIYRDRIGFPRVLSRGTNFLIRGGNLTAGATGTTSVATALESWTVVTATPGELLVNVPASHPVGKFTLRVSHSSGSALLTVEIQN